MSQVQSGFRGSIEGASIADLVQMECLGGQRRAVRVTGDGEVGYLFFSEGHVTHAITSDLVGEAAAIEILGWTSGAFEPCQASWPRAP